jgi:epoxyqueuosine reductase
MPSFNEWIERTIAATLREAPENRLPDFAESAIFDRPAIGVARGDDPIFEAFHEAVDPAHLLPREILRSPDESDPRDSAIRVVAWALPFSEEVRRSNRIGEWPSAMYSVARNNGGALNRELAGRLVRGLRAEGFAAASPMLTGAYDAFRSAARGFASTWSERHAAFGAGLGTFGLNGFLITRAGAMARLGSLVTDAPLDPSDTRPSDHRAPCLADGGKNCGACVGRCPAIAISPSGLDKEKCYRRRNEIRARSLDGYAEKFDLIPSIVAKAGKKETGYSLGCALCASGVPCESESPFASIPGAACA